MNKKTSFTYIFAVLLCLVYVSGASAQVNLSSGLIASYPFNGNANDASGNGHDGIVNHATLTTDRFGNSNSAYSFDGSKKGITIPALGDYHATGVSISLWVNTSKKSSALEVIDGKIGVFYLNIYRQLSFIAVFDGTLGNNTSADASSTKVITGKWVNLTATNDGSTTRIYVNGNLEKSYAETLTTGGSDLIIANKNFVGSIDDIRIYNRALSDQEAAAIYALTQ